MSNKEYRPTLAQLRTFVTIAENKHFGTAAAKLNISQPSLSQALVALESGLNVQLIERSTRRVIITPAGEKTPPPSKSDPRRRRQFPFPCPRRHWNTIRPAVHRHYSNHRPLYSAHCYRAVPRGIPRAGATHCRRSNQTPDPNVARWRFGLCSTSRTHQHRWTAGNSAL